MLRSENTTTRSDPAGTRLDIKFPVMRDNMLRLDCIGGGHIFLAERLDEKQFCRVRQPHSGEQFFQPITCSTLHGKRMPGFCPQRPREREASWTAVASFSATPLFAGRTACSVLSTSITPRKRCHRCRLAPCISVTALQDAVAYLEWPSCHACPQAPQFTSLQVMQAAASLVMECVSHPHP